MNTFNHLSKNVLIIGVLLLANLLVTKINAATLKFATIAPDGTSWMKVMRQGAKEVYEQTNGRVKIKFYPGGVMGNDKSVLRKIRIGQLQGGAITGGSLASLFPDAQIYSLPFQFMSIEQVTYVRQHMDHLLHQGLEKKGLINLGISDGGFAYLFSKTPVKHINDLKGHRVWVPDGDVVGQAVFESIGITPIPLPIGDVYTSLQTGLLDVVVVNPTGAVAFQWYTKFKYMTDVPLVFLVGMLVVDKKTFYRLSVEDQASVRRIMMEKFYELDSINNADNNSARMALQKNQIEFVQPTDEEKNTWRQIADRTIKGLAKQDAFTQNFFNIMQKHLSDFNLKQMNK